jgi:hypothetical protein
MNEPSSTLGVQFRWAAKKDRRSEEVPPTGFFLFKEEVGRVGVRGRDENPATGIELHGDGAEGISTADSDKGSSTVKPRPVPQTRMLSSQPDQRYILLKKYEGFVTGRSDNTFSARLFENNSDYPVVEAEFELEELSETDRELAIEGAPLVWTIGYAYEGSTRKRESLIYLRRLPTWSDNEIQKGRSVAEDLTRGIQWE